MTGQIDDEVTYNGENYALLGFKGKGKFSRSKNDLSIIIPKDFGMKPMMRSTACRRGYVMKYAFTNKHLILDEMKVNADKYPEINGVSPHESDDKQFERCYKNLNYETSFTGKIILGKDFIQKKYIQMGFQPSTSYKTVIEIHVKNGEFELLKDLSEK